MQSRNRSNAQGIDVSRYQGVVDWAKVKASGKSFVYMKASQGTSLEDPRFVANAQGAKAVGMLIGAYHYLEASNTAAAKQEAQHFVATMKKVGAPDWFDLPPVLDYETNPAKISQSAINAVAAAFLEETERLTGRKPILYTGNAFAANFDKSLGAYDVWIARYSETRVPDDRPAWSKWTFWQYSETGRVDGISGNVDLNEYAGTLAQLKSYAGKGTEGENDVNKQRDIDVVSPWAEKDWEKAKAEGYFDGTRPGAPLTREEGAILLDRVLSNLLQIISAQRDRIDELERRLEAIEKNGGSPSG